ncbi:MAG: hypothetical protein AAGE18_17800 [Pseudomonadota bacterium]
MAEDLRDAVQAKAGAALDVEIYPDLEELATAIARWRDRVFAVFVAYDLGQPALHPLLDGLRASQTPTVLIDGILADQERRKSPSWFLLAKPFTDEMVGEVVDAVMSSSGPSGRPSRPT